MLLWKPHRKVIRAIRIRPWRAGLRTTLLYNLSMNDSIENWKLNEMRMVQRREQKQATYLKSDLSLCWPLGLRLRIRPSSPFVQREENLIIPSRNCPFERRPSALLSERIQWMVSPTMPPDGETNSNRPLPSTSNWFLSS